MAGRSAADLLLLALLWGCGGLPAPAGGEGPPAPDRGVPAPELEPLALPPVSTFARTCARCHGPEGAFYGEGFAADKGREELARVVAEMMRGPAFLAPTPPDIAAMTAYHRALSAGEPFIAVVACERREEGHRLTIQVRPGDRLVIDHPGGRVALRPDAEGLAVTPPLELPLSIAARGGRGRRELTFPGARYSHGGEPSAGRDP